MTKAPSVAGEVDSYCTKCRLDLNHRVVSMKASKPHQVMCLTCNTQHLYRKPASVATAKAPRAAAARAARAPSAAKAKLEKERVDREVTWQKAIAGRAMSDFTAYKMSGVFEDGQLIKHKKFGDGVVLRIVDATKVEVLFQDQARTLAHSQPG
jgi:hypothetical protein